MAGSQQCFGRSLQQLRVNRVNRDHRVHRGPKVLPHTRVTSERTEEKRYSDHARSEPVHRCRHLACELRPVVDVERGRQDDD